MRSWLYISFRYVLILVIFSADSLISFRLRPKCLLSICQMAIDNDHHSNAISDTAHVLSEPVIISKLFLFGNEFTQILLENDGSQSFGLDLGDQSSSKSQLRGIRQLYFIIITIDHLFS